MGPTSVQAIQPLRLALFQAACIVTLGGLGAADGLFGGLGAFDLNKEATVPAAVSYLLLAWAAILATLLSAPHDRRGSRDLVLVGMALMFAFMAVDEASGVHERVDDWSERSLGIQWQVAYAPLLLGGAAVWLGTLRRLRSSDLAPRLFVLGAAAWVTSQLTDVMSNRGFGELAYPALVVPEEMLEMTGSALFGLALLIVLRQVHLGAEPTPVGTLAREGA
jgi:hypothetical protein